MQAMSADIIPFPMKEKIPNNIRRYRKERGWSLEELAFQAGYSHSMIWELEQGRVQLSVHHMRKIAAALGILPSDLLDDADKPATLNDTGRKLQAIFEAATPEQQEAMTRLSEAITGFSGFPAPELDQGKRQAPPRGKNAA